MEVDENFVIIDDIIPKNYQDILENRILNPLNSEEVVNWFLNPDLDVQLHSTNHNDTKNVGFSHVMVNNSSPVSLLNDLFLPLVAIACEQIEISNYQIIQSRLFLQAPIGNNERKNDKLHVDLPYQHTVLLYYINDSDGDTVFSNLNSKDITRSSLDSDTEYEIIKRVTPKKGRGVFFNGRIFHASSKPSKNVRCVANFNLVI